jgi:hypothetical protein
MDLWWTISDCGRHRWLRAGLNENPIAWLHKREKHWEAIIWLPDITAPRKYGPLAEQVDDVETACRHWFDMANTSRPAD